MSILRLSNLGLNLYITPSLATTRVCIEMSYGSGNVGIERFFKQKRSDYTFLSPHPTYIASSLSPQFDLLFFLSQFLPNLHSVYREAST